MADVASLGREELIALIGEQQRLILELRAEIEQLKEIAESAGRTVFQE